MKIFRVGWIMSTALLVTTITEAQSKVEITGDAQHGYQLSVNESPFIIRGVGGNDHLDVLAASGGNAIRTWGVGEETPGLLRKAQENNIMVSLGIWIGHERHGFDYTDTEQLEGQRRHVEEAVRKYKDHPALLVWGLGNEIR
jgi:beta-galactosidase/beta-glucuronidase